ncbi:hypothetical protein DC083_04820 [Ignatzschineria ureiclastica]|uniref:Uncharacterized protein n=1 Tax=Ignatzschineria ureiclastica TaxID=472582 RepID=A0A2U2AEY6_9GAMM|nr:hypothetical protein [Ignatzschineria ureiclastica]PWD81215.1 hypothetical protein DC083_04820 [Ignatzschineria ureiclastica]GGZ97189.1 hypothetical protein GCM10007162_11680 [Ignatzschineria ureiclastica]
MIPLLVGVGAVVGVAALFLSAESQAAEREWNSRRVALSDEIDYQTRRLREHAARSQNYLQYKSLVNEHYRSVQVGNEAYQLLKNCRVAINGLREAIHQAKSVRNTLKAELNRCHKKERHEIFEKMALYKETIDQFYEDLKRYSSQKDEFYAQVQMLNRATSRLKEQIRDTGEEGRAWYARLETRTESRAAHTFIQY